jgi:hypothetical protein
MRTVMTFPLVVVLASAQIGALAQDKPPRKVVHDVMLDIDRDGRMDRAVLVRQADSRYDDLWIYLRTGDELLDLSRRPDFVKDRIADDRFSLSKAKAEDRSSSSPVGRCAIIPTRRPSRSCIAEAVFGWLVLRVLGRRSKGWAAAISTSSPAAAWLREGWPAAGRSRRGFLP